MAGNGDNGKRYSVYLSSYEKTVFEKVQQAMAVPASENAIFRAAIIALAEKMKIKMPKEKK